MEGLPKKGKTNNWENLAKNTANFTVKSKLSVILKPLLCMLNFSANSKYEFIIFDLEKVKRNICWHVC